jgi:hypothetical protein
MATTRTTITKPNRPITYVLSVVFTVDARSHENLQHEEAIRNEAASWLESLDATVRSVSVRKVD